MLIKENMKLPRKRRGASKYVRAFVKLIAEMASDGTGVELFGEVEVMIWETLLQCDDRGRQEKARRQNEKTMKKKREKKKAKHHEEK